MKFNIGNADRLLRIAVGFLLVVLTIMGTIGAWGWIGIVPLATGLIGTCPAYAIFGMNTCASGRKS